MAAEKEEARRRIKVCEMRVLKQYSASYGHIAFQLSVALESSIQLSVALEYCIVCAFCEIYPPCNASSAAPLRAAQAWHAARAEKKAAVAAQEEADERRWRRATKRAARKVARAVSGRDIGGGRRPL